MRQPPVPVGNILSIKNQIPFARSVSTTSAIVRGIGRSGAPERTGRVSQLRHPRRPSQDRYDSEVKYPASKLERFGNAGLKTERQHRSKAPGIPKQRQQDNLSSNQPSRERPFVISRGRTNHSDGAKVREGKRPSRNDRSPDHTKPNQPRRLDPSLNGRREFRVPISIPYTTPASEFLYGRSVIRAALQAEKRKLYKLYFNNVEKANSSRLAAEEPLINLAHAKNVDVQVLRREDGGRLLDAMSGGRPHNGMVLEASPIPRLSCKSLEDVNFGSGFFKVSRIRQSDEDLAVNGSNSEVPYQSRTARYPFVLLLDGILDTGNIGAILRTAFFLGVDAVAVSSHGSPLTPAALKASSGAAEMLPILSVHDTGQFILSSQQHGWKFYAAVPSKEQNEVPSKPTFSLDSLGAPLTRHASVLMLGGEGTGLWKDLQWKSDHFVTIHGLRAGQAGVDSLNVSVAAALLAEAFLRPSSSTVSAQDPILAP